MSTLLKVIDQNGEETIEHYILRAGGWTEERYFAEAPESRFVEFEDGEIIMHSPVNMKHQDIARFLTSLTHGFVQERKLGKVYNGPATVQLRPGLDYEPDFFFVSNDQLSGIKEQHFSGAPALVIEVISPGSKNYDLKQKAANYRTYGVPEYWVVDHEHRTFYVHLLPHDPREPYIVSTHQAGRIESRAIPGFWLDVQWLWCEPLPTDRECLEQILSP